MLVLTRKEGQEILIGDGADVVTVRIIGIKGETVRLGLIAEKHIPIHRREVFDLIHRPPDEVTESN